MQVYTKAYVVNNTIDTCNLVDERKREEYLIEKNSQRNILMKKRGNSRFNLYKRN
ncbi:MAG: hypothetical protein JWN30_2447 [Bacilli bacterium]|nr:hypothetical protein [Bacilli bacterium]